MDKPTGTEENPQKITAYEMHLTISRALREGKSLISWALDGKRATVIKGHWFISDVVD